MANFFEGLAQGLQGAPEEVGRLLEQRARNRAMTALGNVDWTKADNPAAPPPRAGPPPAPAPAGAPDPGLMKLATPMAAGPAPAAPRPQVAGPGPQAGPSPMAGPPPGAPRPMPQVQPQPAQPPAQPQHLPDPNLSATAQPGVQFDNPIAEANQTWGAIVNSIKQANPGIDPRTLMRAAEMQLDNIKGIAPTTRAIMSGQIKAQQLNFDMQYKSARLQQLNQKLEIDLRNAKTKEDQVRIMDDYHKNLIALGEDRIAATERGQDMTLQGRRESNANRIEVARMQGSNRVELQGMRDQAAAGRAAAALNGKRGPAMVAAIAKIKASGQEVTEDTINTLSTIYGDTGGGAPAQTAAPASPAPRVGGRPAGVPANAKRSSNGKWYWPAPGGGYNHN